MFVEDCYNLGYIYKAHGINGELIVRTELKLSEETVKKWETIFLKMEGILVPFFIEDIFLRGESELQLKLEDINSEIQIKEFREISVFIDKKDYQQKDETFVFYEWIEYSVLNKEGIFVGEITELLDYPGQKMLKIENKEAEDIVVPAIEKWIISVNQNTKEIVIDFPDGLLELNRSEEKTF